MSLVRSCDSEHSENQGSNSNSCVGSVNPGRGERRCTKSIVRFFRNSTGPGSSSLCPNETFSCTSQRSNRRGSELSAAFDTRTRKVIVHRRDAQVISHSELTLLDRFFTRFGSVRRILSVYSGRLVNPAKHPSHGLRTLTFLEYFRNGFRFLSLVSISLRRDIPAKAKNVRSTAVPQQGYNSCFLARRSVFLDRGPLNG